MGENSNIEWTDHTFNPWRGCTHATAAGEAHPGCTHCYAEQLSKRNPKALGVWGERGVRVMGTPAYWRQPLKWNEAAEREGVRKRVFCASLADVLEDWQGPILDSKGRKLWRCWDNTRIEASESRPSPRWSPLTMDDLRRDLFALIDATPNLDWLLLTKRPENIQRMWRQFGTFERVNPECFGLHRHRRDNVWLLTSVSNQATADALVPELLKCRHLVPVLGLSCEPLLGPINFRWRGLDWVIAGGESGPHARPMHPDWARSLRGQCQAAGVPFFFKQWGEWAPNDVAAKPQAEWTPCGADRIHVWDGGEEVSLRIGKKAAGRLLDEMEWDEFPKT
jgi:protein gp37